MNGKPIIKVLLVEHNHADVRLIELELEDAGYIEINIESVVTVSQAKQQLREKQYDVILLDMDLPDSTGADAIREIQSTSDSIPIVILSGVQDNDLVEIGIGLGVQEYLVKGVGDGHLIARSIRYAIERHHASQHLAQLAHYDKLTGLANRELFYQRLTRALARARRSDKIVGMMFLDLDRFKEVNDSLGHHAGDELLIEVSKRLNICTRQTDTVARLGGDEFTVILEGTDTLHNIVVVAKKILAALQQPVSIDQQEVFVTSSIGITLFPQDGDNVEVLLKNADTAMYQAKEQGRNRYQFYSSAMNRDAYKRLQMEAHLHKALSKDEFSLFYQPKLDMESGDITGAEALIRWNNDEIGSVPPDQFIPLAEDNGLILPISEWVLRTACRQLRIWLDKGLPEIRVAVNLSARQFRQGDLTRLINDILKEERLTPKNLALEITESLLMTDKDESMRILRELKAMGFQIFLDDFGTGYSSLSYLKKFPIDALKIDRSFVMDIPDDPDDMAISGAIIAMSHALRLDVVAEGIETMAQYNFLHSLGCDQAQGYLFSKPVSAKEFEQLISEPVDFSDTLERVCMQVE